MFFIFLIYRYYGSFSLKVDICGVGFLGVAFLGCGARCPSCIAKAEKSL